MTNTELLAELREAVGDTVAPYAWSDARLMLWLAEGQDKFCERTGYWTDRTTFSVTTVLDQLDYPIDPRIIEIKSVWDGARRLTKFTETSRPGGDAGFSDQAPSRPQFWQVDGETSVLTLLEPPEAGIVLNLRVHRRSKAPLNRKTATITLAGAKRTGDVVTVAVAGAAYAYTTLSGDASLTAVATALAAVIDAASGLVATASGQTITIASATATASITASVAVTGAGATTTATAAIAYASNLEIPEQFHLAMVEYAAFKAFGDHDRELQDPVKAADHLANFKGYVRDGRQAYRRLTGEEVTCAPSPLYAV